MKVPNSLGISAGTSVSAVIADDGNTKIHIKIKGKRYLPMGYLPNHLIHFTRLGKELPHCRNYKKHTKQVALRHDNVKLKPLVVSGK
jgi:hypothetical protein